MTPERWQQVKGVLQEVLELAPQQRGTFLAEVCNGDQLLRLEVESLLEEEHVEACGFLMPPSSSATRSERTRAIIGLDAGLDLMK